MSLADAFILKQLIKPFHGFFRAFMLPKSCQAEIVLPVFSESGARCPDYLGILQQIVKEFP